MKNSLKNVKNILNLRNDILFLNSFYLMLATAVMAGFGFFFWMIVARLFTTNEIGIATTLISAMGLIAVFSLVGFGPTFVRYLPNSKNTNDKLNTGIIIVSFVTLFLATLFVVLVEYISPNLDFISSSPVIAISFVFFCIMSALNVLTDSVFLANRRAKYTLVINTIFSATKMILPIFFIGYGALGIFLAAALSQTVGFILSLLVMIFKFNYRPQLVIKLSIIKRVWRFSASNYVAGVLYMIPISYLPILITNKLGAESSAYFYISIMIGNLVYVIPRATTSSLFAEGSNDESTFDSNIKKSIKIIAILLTPSILILFFFGNSILRIFGESFDSGGTNFLKLVAISAIVVSIYNLFGTLFSVKKDLRSIILINIVYAVSTVLLSFALLRFGLTGIGYAWFGGNAIAGFAGYLIYKLKKK
jgi:O-antigen/teichoic acid export membrane protein